MKKLVLKTKAFDKGEVLTKEQLKKVVGGKKQVEEDVADDCLAYVTNHTCPNTYRTLNEAIAGCDQSCTGVTQTYIC